MRKKGIIQGALILTTANIVTRLLGFFYRIYMSQVIGAEGMGLYQLIVPIYMLIWSISSSGFSTTISKLVSQENAKGQYGNMHRILKQCTATTTVIATVLSILLYLSATEISTLLLKDDRTILSLQILALCFPFMSAGSCIRGYFFGLQESTVPAISQVFEQTVRMAVIYLLSSSLIPKGLEYACAAAVIGMVAGEILSFGYVFISYGYFKKKNHLNKKPSLSSVTTYHMILAMAIPLTLNRVTGSALSTVENILIPQQLQLYGYSQTDAISIFGKLCGMAMPLVMFPSSLLTALSIALVPAISESTAIKNTKRISYTISKSLMFTTIIGIGTAGLFITFPYELGMAIYKQEQIGELLCLLGFICPFLYFQVTLSGILNGLGEQVFIFKNSLISSAINISSIFFLVPLYGIYAFILGWFVSLLVTSYMSIKRVRSRAPIQTHWIQSILKPVISITAPCLIVKLYYSHMNLNGAIPLLICITAIGLLYITFLFQTNCLTKEDIKMLKK